MLARGGYVVEAMLRRLAVGGAVVLVAAAGVVGVEVSRTHYPQGCKQELAPKDGFAIIYCDRSQGFAGPTGSYGFYNGHIEGFEGPWHLHPAGDDSGLR